MEHDSYLTCPAGHRLNEAYRLDPSRRPPFCPKCGQPTFCECPRCGAKIPGVPVAPIRDGFVALYDRWIPELPAFCGSCGEAFPWTAPTDPPQGLFRPGQQFDAFRRISEVIARAHGLLRLADNWMDVSVLDMLAGRQADVPVQVLTKKAPVELKPAVAAFRKQHGVLEVRTCDSFHDRFIFVDDEEVWVFGASLKDAGKAVSFFSRIVEPTVVRALDAEFCEAWASGKPL